MSDFPSLKPKQLMKLLRKQGFEVEPSSMRGGSHIWLSDGTTRLRWAFHDATTIPPGLVKKVLTKDLGLSEKEAKALLSK